LLPILSPLLYRFRQHCVYLVKVIESFKVQTGAETFALLDTRSSRFLMRLKNILQGGRV